MAVLMNIWSRIMMCGTKVSTLRTKLIRNGSIGYFGPRKKSIRTRKE